MGLMGSETSSLLSTGRTSHDDDISHYRQSQSSCSSPFCIILILLTIIGMIIFVSSYVIVPPGTIGIVITAGNVIAYESGLHHKFPLISEVIEMTAKTQKLEQENDIPTKEGLSVQLDTAVYVQFHSF